MAKSDLTNIGNYTRNVLATYDIATTAERHAGRVWYPNAIATLEAIRQTAIGPVTLWEKPARVVPAICAVLSPRTSWQSNIEATRKIVRYASEGSRIVPSVAGVRRNVERAWDIAHTGDLELISGPKVCAFFANLCGDFERVTIDVWAARACGMRDESLMNHLDRTRYVAIELAYRNAARDLGIRPAELQAICWIVERGHGEGTVKDTRQERWKTVQTSIPF